MPRPPSPASASFDPKDYFRTFSYREVVTALCLTLMLCALASATFYCSQYAWHAEYKNVLLVVSIFTAVVLNHVFYKIEHGRPNNYMGRTFADYLLFFLFWIAAEVSTIIVSGSFATSKLDVEIVPITIMFTVLLTMVLELTLSGVKRLIAMFGWHVF